jgi:glycosyltransferase involved in cell wall biosynthesis
VPAQRPILWVLHDMNPFTGGCHFSAGCDRFTNQCGDCIQIANPGSHDITQRSLRIKQRAYRDLNLHVAAPSRWLLAEAQRSTAFSQAAGFHLIPYGLDTERFSPLDKRHAREQLGLPVDKQIVLFGAESHTNERKGFRHLLEAWPQVDRETVLGVMFGSGGKPEISSDQAELRHLGYLSDPLQQRLVYSSADVFVLPSMQDNLPQTGLEAMACGTAVVAFDAGGIPDYVRPGQTGLLAKTADSDALGRQLNRMLADSQATQQMGEFAREVILSEFSQPVESARYLVLIESLLRRSELRAA